MHTKELNLKVFQVKLLLVWFGSRYLFLTNNTASLTS